MAGKRRDVEAITAEVADALRALVSTPKFELIPLSNALERAGSLPPGAIIVRRARAVAMARWSARVRPLRRADLLAPGRHRDGRVLHDGSRPIVP